MPIIPAPPADGVYERRIIVAPEPHHPAAAVVVRQLEATTRDVHDGRHSHLADPHLVHHLANNFSLIGDSSHRYQYKRNPDPYVFGRPGSGSVSQRYGSGSVSFYHQAKIVRKTLMSTVLWLLYDFLSLKNDVTVVPVPSKRKTKKNLVFVDVLKVNDENSRIRIH